MFSPILSNPPRMLVLEGALQIGKPSAAVWLFRRKPNLGNKRVQMASRRCQGRARRTPPRVNPTGARAHLIGALLCSRLHTTPHVRAVPRQTPPPGSPIAITADFPAFLTDGAPGFVGCLCRPTLVGRPGWRTAVKCVGGAQLPAIC